MNGHQFHDGESCFPGCPVWGDDLPMTRSRLVRTASDLRSEHGENPEYDRALVELVNDLLGLSSDNRAETEQALGIVKVNDPATDLDLHRRIEERDEGWFYIGPLSSAQAQVERDRRVSVEWHETHGVWRVEFHELGSTTPALAEFGNHRDQHMAWRYALGAYYGPLECPHADCGYGECSGRWVNGACETHGNGEGRCQQVNEDRLMLVCDDCGEAFDTLATAHAHTVDIPSLGCTRETTYAIKPESEAL